MEQLTATVKLNADNASQAHQLARSVSDSADRGSEVVSYVMDKMQEISNSSKRIGDILGVIDGIAFQTNILALNASVEAARAGEQGRGFAVVASEVRNLAQRSATAAKEIRTLIAESQSRVSEGSEMATKAGETMDEIASEVMRVTTLMKEISSASQEQSHGIEQVNQAVTQMDEVAQQNAALVEQAMAATQSLEEQSQQLVQSMAVFKVSPA
jgi:methyl-accepting chemotaxis protein